jgi:hypothetical protein
VRNVGGTNPLDHLLLFRRGSLGESGQHTVESVVLTQEVCNRILVLQEQPIAIKFICMARACSIWRDESTRSWAWWRSWL